MEYFALYLCLTPANLFAPMQACVSEIFFNSLAAKKEEGLYTV